MASQNDELEEGPLSDLSELAIDNKEKGICMLTFVSYYDLLITFYYYFQHYFSYDLLSF